MDDLIAEFIAETQESLDGLDSDLIAFEAAPDDKALLDKIFRILHTIKGTCGFLGLPRLEKIAHMTETLLDIFRSGTRVAGPDDIAVILSALDLVRVITNHIAAHNIEPPGDDTEILAHIQAALGGQAGATESETEIIAKDQGEESPSEAETPPPLASPPAHEKESASALPVISPEKKPTLTAEEPVNSFLRVHVDTLEELLTMVSELVLTRNQLVQTARDFDIPPVGAALQRLDSVVSSLQDSVMKTRMQPIGNAWTKLPRIIHDIAREQKKKIHLEMSGEDTEIDRQILELIKDPLLHMVRNSADHGIEDPADRIAAGKPEMGIIRLSARHEGGYVLITISDDGKGLSPDKLRATALKKNLASPEQIAAMSDKQLLYFIFAPGFSTAEQVTSISGRGVGMDVVRNNVEKIGGTINLDSDFGKGTRFTISIPLTLAIISALVIEADGRQYALPELAVQELLRIAPQEEHKIDLVGERALLHYRGQTIPLVPMSTYLTCDGAPPPPIDYHDCHVIIVRVGATTYGMIVDTVVGIEEIVVKPLSKLLQSRAIFSGNTIMGDGRVILILDPVGITAQAGISTTQEKQKEDFSAERNMADKDSDSLSLLLFTAQDDTPKAVPAFLVSRIIVIDRDDIEYAGARTVMQYQGRLIDLYNLGDIPPGQKIKTLIFADDNYTQTFGIMVDDITDIIAASLDIKMDSRRPGYVGSAILQGRSTDILDISYFAQDRDRNIRQAGMAQKHILILEDSAFFRHMLQPLLNLAGYQVTLAHDRQNAWEMAQDGMKFDLIVSDTEAENQMMPDITPWKDVPVLALSPQEINSRKDLMSRLNSAFEKAHGKMVAHGN